MYTKLSHPLLPYLNILTDDYFLCWSSPLGDAEEKLRNATDRGEGGGARSEVTLKRRAKRAGRADDSLYRAARQAGLRGLANKFSITASQLGEVLHGKIIEKYCESFVQY